MTASTVNLLLGVEERHSDLDFALSLVTELLPGAVRSLANRRRRGVSCRARSPVLTYKILPKETARRPGDRQGGDNGRSPRRAMGSRAPVAGLDSRCHGVPRRPYCGAKQSRSPTARHRWWLPLCPVPGPNSAKGGFAKTGLCTGASEILLLVCNTPGSIHRLSAAVPRFRPDQRAAC